jgi:hypothetical protein
MPDERTPSRGGPPEEGRRPVPARALLTVLVLVLLSYPAWTAPHSTPGKVPPASLGLCSPYRAGLRARPHGASPLGGAARVGHSQPDGNARS